MKIKHFAGYGSVNAEKVSSKTLNTIHGPITVLTIHVWGNHERGLIPYDVNDAFRWVGQRFARKFTEDNLVGTETKEWYATLPNGVDEDNVHFVFTLMTR